MAPQALGESRKMPGPLVQAAGPTRVAPTNSLPELPVHIPENPTLSSLSLWAVHPQNKEGPQGGSWAPQAHTACPVPWSWENQRCRPACGLRTVAATARELTVRPGVGCL